MTLKVLRIMLSPFVFLGMVTGMTVIPVGPLSLFMGLYEFGFDFVMGRTLEDDHWFFTFAWVTIPWLEAKRFIYGGDPWMD